MTSQADEGVRPIALSVDNRVEPNNLPPGATPHFSWRIDDRSWGTEQAAYRVLVARSRDALDDRDVLWDSGRVESAQAADVPYRGPSLAADSRYFWTVRLWNDEGQGSDFATPETFATAPERPWRGDWIAHLPTPGDTNGYRSRWREPESGEEWVQVDLGATRAVERIELYPAEPFDGPTTPDGKTINSRDTEETYRASKLALGPVAFGFPRGYRVAVGDDPTFRDATVVADRAPGESPDVRRDPATVEADASGRYVRVVATDLPTYGAGSDRLREELRPWAVFALAALAVRDAEGTDLARGRPVTASSSVESDTWGMGHLTNGVHESRMASGSALLRREVDLSKPVESARVHVSGLGYGELYVNGRKVHDSVLDPGWTDYDRRVLYATHEVGDLLHEGPNALGIWLGRGWFGKPSRQWTAFGSPRARLHLTVEFVDGTTREVVSNGDWRATAGPVVENDVYDGETYDARLERDGWAAPGFDDADWAPAVVAAAPPGSLYPQQTAPIRAVETLDPAAIYDHPDGPIVDFGQNHTGWLTLDVEGADPGHEIEIRHAEVRDDDGSLQTADLRTAEATDRYVARGDDHETYEPRFTYHGFRYAQVSNYPGDLTAADVRSRVVHTDLRSTGSFACANEDLDRVQRNARWGLRSNAHSVPTDCPQRDERLGFSGDGHLAAGALLYNFDAIGFHEKFLRDHADAQSPHGYLPATMPNGDTPGTTDPTWTYSWLAIPWRLYEHYGTARALHTHYEGLCRYVDFWGELDEDGLLPDEYSIFGDWVALENTRGDHGEPVALFTNAYYYRSTTLVADIAAVVGNERDAERYRERAARTAEAFNDRYLDRDRGGYEPFTQAANAVPLSLGLVPEEYEEDVASTLADAVREAGGTLRTGFLGTPALLSALTEYGYADLAYHVVSQPDSPGWVYQARQGATTVWERWDGDEQVESGMNSRNHSPFTLVSEWLFEALAGLRFSAALPEERRIDVAPTPVAALPWAEASVETPHGEVSSRWDRTTGGLDLHVEVPWNLTASVRVPVEGDATVRVDDRTVWPASAATGPDGTVHAVRSGDDHVTVDVGPGAHDVRVESSRAD